jgi:PAS domain S-box-containing protein
MGQGGAPRGAAEALSKRLEARSAVFSQLGGRLGAAQSSHDAARVIAAAAHVLLGWDACSLDLYSAEFNRVQPLLNIETVNGHPAEVPPLYSGPHPSPMMQHVLQAGPQLLSRAEPSASHTDYILFGDRARLALSLIIVPIRAGHQTLGFLSVQRYAGGAYVAEDVDTLQTLADHAGNTLRRVWAEQRQRLGEDRFYSIARATDNVVRDWNLETDALWWNSALERVFGYRPEDMAPSSASWKDRIHEADRERVLASLQASMDRGETCWAEEYRFQRKDGSYALVRDHVGFVFGDGQKVVRAVAALVEISPFKHDRDGGSGNGSADLQPLPSAAFG